MRVLSIAGIEAFVHPGRDELLSQRDSIHDSIDSWAERVAAPCSLGQQDKVARRGPLRQGQPTLHTLCMWIPRVLSPNSSDCWEEAIRRYSPSGRSGYNVMLRALVLECGSLRGVDVCIFRAVAWMGIIALIGSEKTMQWRLGKYRVMWKPLIKSCWLSDVLA